MPLWLINSVPDSATPVISLATDCFTPFIRVTLNSLCN